MDRTDSAFDETFPSKSSRSAKGHARRTPTTSTRQRRSKGPSLPASPDSQIAMNKLTSNPPVTSTRPSVQAKPTSPRRKSVTSTSSSSTNKSRKRNPGSLPSSRRTSCTIVDPSRPARHYRIRSAQTCPTLNGEIDDVLALHFRSCSLFQNPSYQQASSLPSSPPHSSNGAGGGPNYGLGVAPPPSAPLQRAATTDFAPRPLQDARPATSNPIPVSAPKHAPPHLALSSPTTDTIAAAPGELTPSSVQHPPTDQTTLLPVPSSTTTHWLSPTTRRTQYAQIARETTGVRGLVRRILPRCVSGPAAQGFYEKDSAGDAGSVRRYRMDVGESEDEEEKSVEGGLRVRGRKLEREDLGRKKWGCF